MRTASFFLIFLATMPAAAQTLVAPVPPGPVLGPRTIVPAQLACTDAPVAVQPSAPLHIVAPHSGEKHELSYRNDVVVLSGGTPQGLAPGQRFYARRFRAPRNGETLSPKDRGSVQTAGWLTVIAADEHSALARIDYACDAIAAGDYLDAYVEPTLPTSVTPDGQTDFGTLWHVLSGADRRESFGPGDMLSVDRGSTHGLASGMRVGFYRDRNNGTPLVELGAGIVLEVSTDTAKVVVERARLAIVSGDYVALRQP